MRCGDQPDAVADGTSVAAYPEPPLHSTVVIEGQPPNVLSKMLKLVSGASLTG